MFHAIFILSTPLYITLSKFLNLSARCTTAFIVAKIPINAFILVIISPNCLFNLVITSSTVFNPLNQLATFSTESVICCTKVLRGPSTILLILFLSDSNAPPNDSKSPARLSFNILRINSTVPPESCSSSLYSFSLSLPTDSSAFIAVLPVLPKILPIAFSRSPVVSPFKPSSSSPTTS